MRILPLALLTAAAAPAAAAPPAPVQTVRIVMDHRHFEPQVIRLRGGQRYRIILDNRDVTGHNFDSKGFFSNASIAPAGAGAQAIQQGLISVPSTSTRVFYVTPVAPGPYNLTSSVALDVASGMQGQILVY